MFGEYPQPPPAHPRSRGENLATVNCWPTASGSSPLTRGKPISQSIWTVSAGLIPAHAGKTLIPALASIFSCGSSPLTRGKRRKWFNPRAFGGLIPAHAGKTRRAPRQRDEREAHPRSRGENVRVGSVVFVRRGSSPLTRGKPAGLSSLITSSRLIPAHAGKTRPAAYRSGQRTAHPRSRGENWQPRTRTVGRPGSSPLTRGKRQPTDSFSQW